LEKYIEDVLGMTITEAGRAGRLTNNRVELCTAFRSAMSVLSRIRIEEVGTLESMLKVH